MRDLKDSGIEWIGEIPKEWEISKIKYVGEFRNGLTYSPNDVTDKENGILVLRSSNIQNGKIDLNDNVYVSTKINSNLIVKKGDILICSCNGSKQLVGKNAIINTDKIVTFGSFMMIFRTKNPKFMYYVLNSGIFTYYLETFSTTTINQLTSKNFGNMNFPFPPLESQIKITNFLDKKCKKIDLIKDKILTQISNLKEFKKSIITKAVTKGLDKNAKFKDSGIEWIGEIPSHWKISKVKYTGEYRNGLTYSPNDMTDENNGILVLRSSNIQNGKIDLKDNVYVSTQIKSNLMIKKGDILICSRNGSKNLIGKNTIINSNITATFGAFMMIYRTKNSKFMYYVLNSDIFSYYLETFLTSTINQLTTTNFGNIKFPFPPLNEQQEIANYLDKKCEKIDEIIELKNKELEILDEYKKSLIYEYVTGKKEVK
ncbi:restriction endonuclease subunit S [Campylobacter corcagiensis]|uniref:Restriction endonuclease subunit S n=1 Tax=Campylobacter corcagiensis TaxID=1448857 RepID=A0A7M1LI01_9BACT|nr:restriction endonuclease subunit S [Campylobacter corcagiensis]QKF64711.1 type I restriction/modification system, specificity subunit [Campylobacter corcagiensis]QOQ87125.1 restriction endonuclease subunit S [Campylobacter corcagiensis]